MRFMEFAALTYLLGNVAQAQLTGTATLSGKILNAQTNAPIPKATVTLTLVATPSASAIALTTPTGDFTFDKLPAGQYGLQANKQGFRPTSFGSRVSTQPGTIVTLDEGARKDALVIRLPLTSTIGGFLVDADGDPIVATDISLYRLTTRDGRPASQQQGGVQSDERGAYRFDVQQPGRYCVAANTNVSRGFNYFNNTGKLPIVTMPVLYPAGCGTEGGRTLEIAAGGRIANLDIVIPSALAARPKGKVVLPENLDRATPVQVFFTSASELFPRGIMMGFPVQPGGEIMGGAIIPGGYSITATYDLAGVKHTTTTRVDFAPGEVKEFLIAPRPTFTLPCKVTVEKQKPEALPPISFYFESPNQMTLAAARVTWQPGKDCRIAEVAPGHWRLSINPVPAGYYVKSARLGSLDVLRKEFDLPDTPLGELAIVLSGAGGEISGELDSAAGAAAIVLAPAVHAEDTLALYRTHLTKADGRFLLPALPPGQYKLYAFEDLDWDQWQSAAYLARFQDSAKLIRVAEGDKLTVKLTRIPAY